MNENRRGALKAAFIHIQFKIHLLNGTLIVSLGHVN
jgi:hypothetical protein